MGKAMPEEKKKSKKITTTTSNIKWTTDYKQIHEVKLAKKVKEKIKE